jgi:hypothetical protein
MCVYIYTHISKISISWDLLKRIAGRCGDTCFYVCKCMFESVYVCMCVHTHAHMMRTHAFAGPFWRVKSRKDKEERHDSGALWIIECEGAEWGGRQVCAQHGVETVDNSKRKAYRLEHVCSGLYLSLSQSQVHTHTHMCTLMTTTKQPLLLSSRKQSFSLFQMRTRCVSGDPFQPTNARYPSVQLSRDSKICACMHGDTAASHCPPPPVVTYVHVT